MSSGFIIYNRDYFLIDMNHLSNIVCDKICFRNVSGHSESVSDFNCSNCPFLNKIKQIIEDE